MKTTVVFILCALFAACAPHADDASPARVTLATFDGVVSGGVLALTVRAPDGTVTQAVVTPLPTTASGSSGTTTPPADGVLLHQQATRSLDGVCNAWPYGDSGVPAGFVGICVPIQFISGFAANKIRHAFVQLTSLVYDGPTVGGSVVTYVKAPSSVALGTDNTYGLWSYGTIQAAGTTNDRRTVNWFFQTTDLGATARFHFTAVALGELAAP